MFYDYFEEKEFFCPCCGKGRGEMNERFMRELDLTRWFANTPFVIASGYRCEAHNREVGGSKTSSHLSGLAADIECKSSFKRYHILKALLRPGSRFIRVGVGENFIHVDLDYDKTPEVIWTY